MNDFDYLAWILSRDYICVDKSKMKEEKQAKGKRCQCVKIKMGRGIKSYDLYEFGSKDNFRLFPFFNHTNNEPNFPNAPSGLIAFCDYIILTEFRNILYILLIEMKRGETAHAHIQLEASKCFIEYVLCNAERIKHHNSMARFDKDKVEIRRIILSYTEKETLNSHMPFKFNRNDVINYKACAEFNIRDVI